MLGIELVGPVWDLGVEYADLFHPGVLWYSNGGFPEGYSQDGWLLGHTLGGSGKASTAMVQVRPNGRGVETGLRIRYATWGMESVTPGTGKMSTAALSLKKIPSSPLENASANTRLPSPLLWELTVEWNREEAVPGAFVEAPSSDSSEEKDWWRIYFRVGI